LDVYLIEQLTKRYGRNRPANDNISLTIRQGEIFGLLGSNGAGKSTLVKQMVNLLAPTSGKIWLCDMDIAKKPAIVTEKIAYMPQKPNALLDLTAAEAIYFTGHLRGMSRLAAKQATNRIIEEWGIGDFRKRVVRHLSGGQNRLVSLAVSLIGARPVLILDEPTNELDPTYRKMVWERLRTLNQTEGTTIILVTHNVQEAEKVLDRVAIMSEGKIAGLGRVSELKGQVDQSVRLELFLKPENSAQTAQILYNIENSQELKPLQWSVPVPRQNAEDAIHAILSSVRLANLEDFRVHTATLEDVYMALTGQTLEKERGERNVE
jgi:ABC-2 type transport system ATP-binding protein